MNHQSRERGICLDRSIIHSQQVFPSVSIIRAATVPRAQTARPSLQRNECALVYFSVCVIRAGDRGVRTYQAVFINRGQLSKNTVCENAKDKHEGKLTFLNNEDNMQNSKWFLACYYMWLLRCSLWWLGGCVLVHCNSHNDTKLNDTIF